MVFAAHLRLGLLARFRCLSGLWQGLFACGDLLR